MNKSKTSVRLYNRVNNQELKQLLFQEPFQRTTISFYKYFNLSEPNKFRDDMYQELLKLQVFGRIYLATEGINAQCSIPQHNLELFKTYIYSIPELNGILFNIATVDDGKSFWVLKIKVRDQIVRDGITDPDFNMQHKGQYITPIEFNQLTATNSDIIIVDMRNHYEHEVGHFANAIAIPSDTFREQLPMSINMMQPHIDKTIIMYCTGGIRCEKASAWMLHNGFKKVLHLQGGIINYVNTVKQQKLENKFIGQMFVFDNRLSEKITENSISSCHQCGEPSDRHINCANSGCHLLFIQCDKCSQLLNKCCSTTCQSIVQLPPEEQRELRKGIHKGANVFNKSRSRLKKLF